MAGTALGRDLGRTPDFGLAPVGLLDDDPAKAGRPVDAVPVLGTLAELTELAVRHRAQVVALAIPGLAPQRVRGLATAAAAVRYLPSFLAALRREVVGSDMRSLDVNRLIGRHEVHVVSADVRDVIEGRRVLVAGAGGSIGSELCRQVHAFNPGALYMLDHDEWTAESEPAPVPALSAPYPDGFQRAAAAGPQGSVPGPGAWFSPGCCRRGRPAAAAARRAHPAARR
ncbi:polysaccharide biosynthesis protein [Kitasatospora sp. NPDC056181]|uniref:nucleoside-diphosphate sugar epimerase/dehydratase n=1 Tax=Kitasatospora sp. NPDC056181 TaxID=3345737 RepID=UPI0035DD0811